MTSLRQKWIAALRSDKYKQDRGRLQRPGNRFCCLGVACDVVREETGMGKWEASLSTYYFVVEGEGYQRIIDLPDFVLKMMDIGRDVETYLIHLNDGKKYSFEQIADYLEGLE